MIVINFKNYVSGKKSLALAKLIQKYLPNSIICPSNIDLNLISENTKLKVYSQNVDPIKGNKNTGFQTLDSLKNSKLKGTLLNHSEHPITKKEISETLREANKLNLKIILCVPSFSKLKSILKLKEKPYAIAFEDPKLISTGKSITKHNPKALKKFVSIIKKTKIIPLCGAGVSTEKDYEEALKIGCKGVLIASAIAKSKNPENLLKKLNNVSIKK